MIFAHQMGASALLLYPDPQHYNSPNSSVSPFPKSQYMPSDAVRHDSLIWNGLGDPQTPGFDILIFILKILMKQILTDIRLLITHIDCPFIHYKCQGMSLATNGR